MMTNKTRVKSAITNIKAAMPDYWASCLNKRLGGGGGCYQQFDSPEELETALMAADWEQAEHPDVMPGCTAFKTPLRGMYGLVELERLPADAAVFFEDFKGVGEYSPTVKAARESEAEETWIILGFEEGIEGEIAFTFHPGEPVRPSQTKASDVELGRAYTPAEAMAMGFDFAQVK